MYICISNAVTEREIRHAVDLSANSFHVVAKDMGVAACCRKRRKYAGRVTRELTPALRDMRDDRTRKTQLAEPSLV